MKQVLAMILALMAASSMAVPAFAENAQTNENTAIEQAAEKQGISFEADKEHNAALGDLLEPGKTYQFKVMITDEKGHTEALNESHMKDRKFSFSLKKGKSVISSIQVVEDGAEYLLEIVTTKGWPSEQAEVKGEMKLANKASGKAVYTNDLSFKVGYQTISDDALAAAKNEEAVIVDSSAPVITQKQMDKLEEAVKGNKVTFANDDWRFSVKVSGQDSVNMLNNDYAIKEIVQKYDDREFKFVSFPGGPQFSFSGTLSINVYEEEDDWDGKFFVYRYYKGKLSKIDAQYVGEDSELCFNTKSLGRFVITNKEIPDGTIIEEGFAPDGSANTGNGSQNSSQAHGGTLQNSSSSTQKPNPGTGAADMTGLAAVMAAIALTAGTVVLKRKEN